MPEAGRPPTDAAVELTAAAVRHFGASPLDALSVLATGVAYADDDACPESA
jgi:hypothetical protein